MTGNASTCQNGTLYGGPPSPPRAHTLRAKSILIKKLTESNQNDNRLDCYFTLDAVDSYQTAILIFAETPGQVSLMPTLAFISQKMRAEHRPRLECPIDF